MTVNRSLVAVVALIAAIATSATGASTAIATPTAAGPFQLTLESQVQWWDLNPEAAEGTFAAEAPFCSSGTFVWFAPRAGAAGPKYRFTCDDGSGSLEISASVGPFDRVYEYSEFPNSWRVLEGTGSYAGLRGKGSQRSELSEGPGPECVDEYDFECAWIVTWRSTLQGVADEDAIAPTIGFSSVKVKKLPRPAGAYSLDVAITLRDDVEGNPVSYLLRVTPTASARELARSFGTAQAGTVSMTMRMRYYMPPRRAVLLRLSASDEVGNESSLDRVLKLPR